MSYGISNPPLEPEASARQREVDRKVEEGSGDVQLHRRAGTSNHLVRLKQQLADADEVGERAPLDHLDGRVRPWRDDRGQSLRQDDVPDAGPERKTQCSCGIVLAP